LLAIRKASRPAFDLFLGPERAEEIARYLETLLTDSERQALNKPTSTAHRRFGARLDPVPRSKRG